MLRQSVSLKVRYSFVHRQPDVSGAMHLVAASSDSFPSSFPVSTVEWIASASIAELPVTTAAAYLQIIITRLTAVAT